MHDFTPTVAINICGMFPYSTWYLLKQRFPQYIGGMGIHRAILANHQAPNISHTLVGNKIVDHFIFDLTSGFNR